MEKTNKKVEKKEINEKVIKKEMNNKLIITVCAAIVAFIGLFFAYNKIYSPKSIFKKAINKGYSKLERYIDDGKINSNSKPIVVTSDFKFKMEVNESLMDDESKKTIEEFEKLHVKEKIGIDSKNNEMIFLLNYLYGEEDLINLGAYLKDEKMYLELKNVYDKYIEVPLEKGSDVGMNVTNEELKYLLKKSKDTLIKNMNSKDFKQSTEKIKKGKKYIKVTKVTYGLSEKTATELALSFLEDISKDSKYIKILAKSSGTTEKEIKSDIDESIKEIKAEVKKGKLDKEVKVSFGVLVKGIAKKHVGYIFSTVDKAKFVYYKNGKNREIRLSKADEDIISSSTEDKKTVITLSSKGQDLTITVNKKDDKNKIVYDYEIDAATSSLTGTVTIDKIKENKDGSGEMKITVEASMMGLIKFKIIGDVKTEYVKKLEFPDISDSVKAENLSNEEQEKIMEKLFNSSAFESFSNTLE